MIADITIQLEDIVFSSHNIAKLPSIESLPEYDKLSSYSQQTLSFCHAWLSGQAIFDIQTSGSTGTPKNIQITRAQMQASARATAQVLGLKTSDNALVCLNTAYIAGKMMLVRAFETGMSLIIIPPTTLPFASVYELIDFTALVPLQLKSMLEATEQTYTQRLNNLKAILVGGAPVDCTLETLIHTKLTAPVYSTYGMTETVSHIALRRLNGPDASEVYKLMPGVEVKIGEKNCLAVEGAVSNYQWLQTNDVVELLDASHFRWLGRADQVVNSGGVKIHTESLENKLQSVMQDVGIEGLFFLAGIPDEQLGEKLCLFIEKASPLDLDQEQALRTWMKDHLHPYEIPKKVFCLPQFRRTPTGKIQRKQTLALILGNNSSDFSFQSS